MQRRNQINISPASLLLRPITGLQHRILNTKPTIIVPLLLRLLIIKPLDNRFDLFLDIAFLPIIANNIHDLPRLLLLLLLLLFLLLHPPKQFQLALNLLFFSYQCLVVVLVLVALAAILHVLGELVGGEGDAADFAEEVGGDVCGLVEGAV
jgi:hypothetical protein